MAEPSIPSRRRDRRSVALVTGGNRGLGFEIVRQLAAKGLSVVLTARNGGMGQAAAGDLCSTGLDVTSIEMDVDDPDSVARGIAIVKARTGRIDVLINNAGVLLDGPDAQTASVLDLPAERLLASFRTNAMGALLTMQHVIPIMRANAYGRIVNVSSRAGQLEDLRPGVPSYRVSKTALNSLTRVTAAEFQAENIKINAMCPGWVRTAMGGDHAPLSVAEGADTAVWLAMLGEDGPTGGFFRGRRPLPW